MILTVISSAANSIISIPLKLRTVMRTLLIQIVGQRNMRKKIHPLPRVMNLVGLKQVNHADVIAVVS